MQLSRHFQRIAYVTTNRCARLMPILRPVVPAFFVAAFFAALLDPQIANGDPTSASTKEADAKDTSDPLIFEGRVKALRHAEVSNRIEGVISAVHFSPGQVVRESDLLFELAPETYQAAVLVARADLDRTQAELRQKQLVLDQQEQLRSKGVASELRYREAANEFAVALAKVAAAEAALKIAELGSGDTILNSGSYGFRGHNTQ